jgi:MoxR-like ATPase
MTLGYPDAEAERALLAGSDRRDLIAHTTALLDADRILQLQQATLAVHAAEPLLAYVQALLARSRHHPGVRVGLSPRAGLALLRAARAHALLLQRPHVLPEDVQALFPAVAAHRLVPEPDTDAQTLAQAILHAVAVD